MAILNRGMAGAPQALQMAYMRDPRMRLAQQLQAGATDASPVGHWSQGLARLAQALAGNRLEGKADAEYRGQAEAYQNDMRGFMAPVMEPGTAGPGPRQGPGGATMRPANAGELAQRAAAFQSPYSMEAARPTLQAAMEREAAEQAKLRDPMYGRTNVRGVGLVDMRNGSPNVLIPEQRQAPQRFMNVPGVGLVDVSGERPTVAVAQQREQPGQSRPMTPDERRSFGVPDNVPAFMGPDGKPATLNVPRQEAVWQIDPQNPQIQVNVLTGERKALPAPPAMNEGQANAALFADRMAAAEPIISQFGNAGTSWGNKIGSAVPLVGNSLVSGDYQRLDQARRDFVNAVLRRESGAVIAESEFDNANRQYFPQPGDSAETIAQKARNRRTALEGIARAAGTAYKPPGAPQQAQGGNGGPAADPLGIR
jgi:hypothetical protein